MKLLKVLIPIIASGLLLGCASTADQTTAKYDKDNDPRVGEEVRNVCFTRSISGWDDVDNDRHAVLLHMSNNRSYKLSLVGACDADQATFGVAVITRSASSCVTTGDKIATDAQSSRYASCVITHIYEWNEDAGEDTGTKTDETETAE